MRLLEGIRRAPVEDPVTISVHTIVGRNRYGSAQQFVSLSYLPGLSDLWTPIGVVLVFQLWAGGDQTGSQ